MLNPDMLDQRLMELAGSDRLTAAVRDYARPEFVRGLQYHIDYVGRLGMVGDSVLDAGCGVGNWSLALARYYRKVTALEFNPDRLACTRLAAEVAGVDLDMIEGSIEELPFPDAAFDGVFCNGVIFLTDWRKSLSELQRVLKPGGRLYMSFDDLAWWDHLIHDRGTQEPHLLPMACGMLANQLADYLQGFPDCGAEAGLARLVSAGAVVLQATGKRGLSASQRLRSLWHLRRPIFRLLGCAFSVVAGMLRDRPTRAAIAGAFADTSLQIPRAVAGRVFHFGTREQKTAVAADLVEFLARRPVLAKARRGFCIGAGQMAEALAEFGLPVVGMAPEGLMVVDTSKPPPPPIYPQAWGVVEVLARKPTDGVSGWLGPDYFRRNGRAAALRFSQMVNVLVLSNVAHDDRLALAVSNHYLSAAQAVDRQDALTRLVEALRRERGEGDLFETVYRFVQDSVFHHPLLQLVRPGGLALFDSVAVLLCGIGRCGHVAALACDLYRAAGFEARVTQLHKHLCCEVFVEGRWRVVDADAFKGGVWPRNHVGGWATLDELRADPVLLDQLPAVGLQLSSAAPWSQGLGGLAVTGYTDVGLAWERPYLSYLYFGVSPGRPAAPPVVEAMWLGPNQLRLTAREVAAGVRRVRLSIGAAGRGWCYEDVPDASYLRPPCSDVALLEVDAVELKAGVTVAAPAQTVYVNVFALDEHQLDNRDVWLWPAPEIIVAA